MSNKNQEDRQLELERLIGEVLNQNLYEVDGETLKVNVLPTEEIVKQQASAILSAGYVRLSDVELDEEKIFKVLWDTTTDKLIPGEEWHRIAHTIAQASKEIIKVKNV